MTDFYIRLFFVPENFSVRDLFFRKLRCSKISKEIAINEEIRVKEVRLISETGEQLGIVTS